MYVRLARMEESEARKEFGDRYERYAARTPGFIPRLPHFAQRGDGTA
jgi:methanethiol S-methyltransferase